MITIKHSGSFNNIEKFLKNSAIRNSKHRSILEKYGRYGVNALAVNTPIDSGKTALTWDYELQNTKNGYLIIWTNDHMDDNNKITVAVLLQYGHATNGGGYVKGKDYINPVMKPIFEDIADLAWKEVTK